MNDVILFGYVKYKPEITENVTFLEVVTQFFDRYVVMPVEFKCTRLSVSSHLGRMKPT